MKKLFKTLLAFALVFSISQKVIVKAEEEADLTDHTFTAYQIFSGTQAEDDVTLGSVEWGTGIDGVNFLKALQASTAFGTSNPFKDLKSAAEVAAAMKDWSDNSAYAKAFAKIALNHLKGNGTAVESGTTELDAGYYLIVDTTVGDVEAYNPALLQLTQKGTFEIQTKITVPEVEKTINGGLICKNTDEDHVHDASCYNWTHSDKKPIGGVEEYKIETGVPATATDYSYYYFVIKDTMYKGLTLDATSFVVKFIDDEGKETVATAADYTLVTGDDADPYTFQIALKDAKAHAGETVIVTYSATVNNEAVIGVSGNPNEVSVDYSNKPDYDYKGTNDGFPAEESNNPIGETPKSVTLTFVTQVAVHKIDEKGQPLQDAEFTLTGETMSHVLVYKKYFEADDNGTYYKLVAPSANGEDQYTTEAPREAGMVIAEEGATEGYVVDNDYTGDDAIVDKGVTYRPYVPETDTGKQIYVHDDGNEADYASTEQMYKQVEKFVEETVDGNYKVSAFVDSDGNVVFIGIEEGSYTLEETKVPAGYNPLPAITFDIEWTAPTDETITKDSKCSWVVKNVKPTGAVTYDSTTGTFSITVVNQKGSTLPETGGIGTKIFYIAGSILVVGAAVLFITKKRMKFDN